MNPCRLLFIAGCIEDFDFETLAQQQVTPPESFYEPGMGPARTVTPRLASGREAVFVWLELQPRCVQVMLEQIDGEISEADARSAMQLLTLDPSRFDRVSGQVRWRED